MNNTFERFKYCNTLKIKVLNLEDGKYRPVLKNKAANMFFSQKNLF